MIFLFLLELKFPYNNISNLTITIRSTIRIAKKIHYKGKFNYNLQYKYHNNNCLDNNFAVEVIALAGNLINNNNNDIANNIYNAIYIPYSNNNNS